MANQPNKKKTLKLLKLIKKDLELRSDESPDGGRIINISDFIWVSLNQAIRDLEK